MDSFDAGVVAGMEKIAISPTLAGRTMGTKWMRMLERPDFYSGKTPSRVASAYKRLRDASPEAFDTAVAKATGGKKLGI